MLAMALLLVTPLACSDDDDGPAATSSTDDVTSSSGEAQPIEIEVELTGDAEVPGPGDDDGAGTALLTITPGSTELCYELDVVNVDDIVAAHVHEGREGIAGPIAVTLDPPTSGSSEGCVETSTSIVEGLADGSREFYVNVHSTELPDGAVRGQVET
jgi:hypothetical protein